MVERSGASRSGSISPDRQFSRVGVYDHLNNVRQDRVLGGVVNLDALAEHLEDTNYGTHRMLSALIRVREAREAEARASGTRSMDYIDPLTVGLRKLIDDGGF